MFGAVRLVKKAGNDKYKHSGYGTGFNNHGIFSLSNGNEFSKNVILFGADMSRHVGNKKIIFYPLEKDKQMD